MSTAARQVAEARAEVRGLTNITWVTASIMELPTLGLGKFDYIECCGVLHHLESTAAGLIALKIVLKDGKSDLPDALRQVRPIGGLRHAGAAQNLPACGGAAWRRRCG
jgi:ubiquinone/menaquinone biosynthesis C-methylase UbiE